MTNDIFDYFFLFEKVKVTCGLYSRYSIAQVFFYEQNICLLFLFVQLFGYGQPYHCTVHFVNETLDFGPCCKYYQFVKRLNTYLKILIYSNFSHPTYKSQ